MEAVIADVATGGVTEKELADAKVRYRSNFYSQLESSFGKTHLLSCLALFRDDPNQINSLLTPFEKVTAAQIKAAAAKYLVASNRTVIDRVPEKKPGGCLFLLGVPLRPFFCACILLTETERSRYEAPILT